MDQKKPDTTNFHLVASSIAPGGVVFTTGIQTGTRLPRYAALNLAAQIVALADPEDSEFARMLEAVRKA